MIIPDSVNSIGKYAFQDCVNLVSVTIPDSVTIIDYATFKGCSRLQKVSIGSSVTRIGFLAFEYCSSLRDVTIPKSVSRIQDEAFKHTGLQQIIFEGNAPIFGDSVFRYSSLFGPYNGGAYGKPGRVLITEGATGFGHNVIGVASANIGKINGVETANVGKVIGVD